MITRKQLKELLYYHPESGDFIWRVDQNRARAGTQAGTLDNGYIRIRIDGRKYRAHRLAVFYMTGKWPAQQVDHKDRTRSANHWVNLRDADGVQQNANKNLQRNNRAGERGVSAFKGKFRAVIYKAKKQRFLGYFKTKAEAAAAYQAAAKVQFGDFHYAPRL